MPENDIIDLEAGAELPVKHRFAKLVIGTAVGFIAKELTEKLYDNFVANRQAKATEV
jgi:hypothetical protein